MGFSILQDATFCPFPVIVLFVPSVSCPHFNILWDANGVGIGLFPEFMFYDCGHPHLSGMLI
jgi:hypothetical protein